MRQAVRRKELRAWKLQLKNQRCQIAESKKAKHRRYRVKAEWAAQQPQYRRW